MGELLAIVGAATMLSVLAIALLAVLGTRRQRSKRRERALAKAAAMLDFVSTHDDVHRVAVDAALDIVGGEGTGVAFVLAGADSAIVATAGELLPWELEGFGERASMSVVVDGELHGELVIHTRDMLSGATRHDLELLVAQVELALGRATPSHREEDDLLASAV